MFAGGAVRKHAFPLGGGPLGHGCQSPWDIAAEAGCRFPYTDPLGARVRIARARSKARHISVSRVALAVVVCVFLLLACLLAPVVLPIRLPNGFEVFRPSKDTIIIIAPRKRWPPHPSWADKGIVAGPRIDGLRVYAGRWVAGRAVASPGSEVGNLGPTGYFVLDTVSGAASLGLTEAQYRAEVMQQVGQPAVPLTHPDDWWCPCGSLLRQP